MLEKLLWNGKNKWQVAGAAAGAFIGLFLLLLPLQLFVDIQAILNESGESGEDFVMINKPVNLLNTIGLKSGFSASEVEDIRKQAFVEDVGEFTSNQFKVSASSQMIGFYTELFFEALPNQFIDKRPSEWQWSEGDEVVPIILARDYLALYNFGFAPSQGLPQFTQSTISAFSFTVNVSGNGQRQQFRGKIVGFSDRINSILVPQNFMAWANETYGSGSAKNASRLLLKTRSGNEDFEKYIKEEGYEISRGKLIGGQMSTILNAVLSVIGGIGVLIFLLSLLIFTLSFRLIIAESRQRIDLLLQLGYRPSSIIKVLTSKLLRLIVGIGGFTLLVLFPVKYLLSSWFMEQGFVVGIGLHWSVFVLGGLVCLLFFGAVRMVVKRGVITN